MNRPNYTLSEETVKVYRKVLYCAVYNSYGGQLSNDEIKAVDYICANMEKRSVSRAVSYYVHGKTLSEIAKAEGVNISSVSRTIDTVNRKLADILHNYEWYDKFRIK